MDQALEQTINREAKSDGGIIGFTRRKGALLRWLLTRHITWEYSEMFKELCLSKNCSSEHEEMGKKRMTRDIGDVLKTRDYIVNHCQDRFDLEEVPDRLINIVTRHVASAAVEESLGSLPSKGIAAYEYFVNEWLVKGQKCLWDAIPKKTVATFTDMKKKLTNDKHRKIIIDTEVLFRRLLVVE